MVYPQNSNSKISHTNSLKFANFKVYFTLGYCQNCKTFFYGNFNIDKAILCKS
jgi:Zn-dependent M16 (insulinase) family peptidase